MPKKTKYTGGKTLYCLKCKDHTGTDFDLDKDGQIKVHTSGHRYMVKGKCAVCGTRKSMMVSKEAVGNGLISSLFGFKSPFEGVPILGSLI